MIDLRLGDCLEVMKTIKDNSIDAIITDPPYGTYLAVNGIVLFLLI
jgi:DNA modification methylase